MQKSHVLAMTVVIGFVAIRSVPVGAQGPANELTYYTFSGPVEIPGQVLPAGTYQFRLAEPMDDRHIVQILSKDGSKSYGMLLTIPDERLKPTGKPTMTFEEHAAGAPEAIRAFFYPGRLFGEEFVYPKARAIQLARANHVAVPAMPSELAAGPSAGALKKAPLSAINPEGREVAVVEVILVPKGTR